MTEPAVADEPARESFEPNFFEVLFETEDDHFWFHTRNRIILTRVNQLASGLAGRFRLLEVGSGTGNVLRVLYENFPQAEVYGMDLYAEGFEYSKRRVPAALVQADMHKPPFGAQFDIIGLFDVLEHLPDDRQVLRDLDAMLRPGGLLLITVPAHPQLWSYFDESSRHCRRYRPDELRSKLIEAGYQVEYLTQFMMALFPLMWLGRRVAALYERIARRDESSTVEELAEKELRPNPALNAILKGVLGLEARWLARGRTLPLGTSLFAVARKGHGGGHLPGPEQRTDIQRTNGDGNYS